jgi:hypothetical protein
MEVPSLTIKLKGAQALQALAWKTGPAVTAGKAAIAAAPIEGARWVAAGKAGAGKSAAALKAATAASVASTKAGALAAGTTLPSAGTIWSGTGLSLGLGLGLGALGPLMLLGAVGLTATGIYFYRRGRIEAHEHSDDELPQPEIETPA